MKLDLTRKSTRLALADVDLGARIAFAKEWYWHNFGHLVTETFEVGNRATKVRKPRPHKGRTL